MTLLAPGYLFTAIAAAVAIVALHLIVTRRPRATLLPTARFAPDMPVTSTTRAMELSDLLLMLLRVLAVLLAGLALARPVLAGAHHSVASVVMADVSRDIASIEEVRDSVRAHSSSGDLIIAFDTTTAVAQSADSLRQRSANAPAGSVSAALIKAIATAPQLRMRADSVQMVLVSPLLAEETDSATLAIRDSWKGRMRMVRVTPARRDSVPATVSWSDSLRPPRAVERAVRDTVSGVSLVRAFEGAAFVGSMVRRWAIPSDSLSGAEVIARWSNGDVAAIELSDNSRCERSVLLPPPSTPALFYRADFRIIQRALRSACRFDATRVSSAVEKSLAGEPRAVSATLLPPVTGMRSPFLIPLLIAALVVLVLEMLARVLLNRSRA